nr:putative ribonuclease H-like domain-containing protein [Tanacetum cinerariifolium]
MKDVSSLRYIALPNWVHDVLLESSSSKPQDESSTKVLEGSGNLNPTTSSSNPPADQMEKITVESPIPTDSSPVPTACLNDSPEPSSKARLISKRVANQEETPSLDNILSLTNRFEDILGVESSTDEAIGVEADVSNMEASITAALLLLSESIRTTPKDPVYPARVYKVEKAMYGLHQAPRAWYGTLSKYLLSNSFQRGTIDQTLFIRRQRGNFIVVQVYVDDIIFRSSNLQLCREFEALMHGKFQMSAMGELNFFLGLQVLQKEDGIFLSQDKYVGDILKKFGYSDVRSSNTPMDKENPWGKDGTGKDVDLHLYRSMIGSLMYLTASRSDIMFAICACTIVATSTTEAEYVAADSCYGQVLWIQNQLHDYGMSMSCKTLSKKISTSILRLLEKNEHNAEFHPIVDFIEASPLRVVLLFDSMFIQQGEGSGTPTEPHHTPSQEAQPSSPTHIFTSSIPTVIPIPTVPQTEPTPLRQYTRKARIAQSSALPPVADEPASPVIDVSKREACPTDSDFIADQDRATIANLERQHSALLVQFKAQEVEINKLKERVKVLEDNQGVIGARSVDDAPINGRRIDEEEGITRRVSTDTEEIKMDEGKVAAERTSEDTEELATVLTSMDATTVLAGGIDVPTSSYSIPTAGPHAVDIHTGSEVVPTASPIVATATVVTPYSRRKGKEVMVESDTPKK